MILTPRRLKEIGQTLYGEHWRATMAKRLSKTKRTIERWADGSRNIRAGVLSELDALIDEQISALEALRSAKRDQE